MAGDWETTGTDSPDVTAGRRAWRQCLCGQVAFVPDVGVDGDGMPTGVACPRCGLLFHDAEGEHARRAIRRALTVWDRIALTGD